MIPGCYNRCLESYPSSPQDKNVSSFTSLTQSMLPECPLYTNCDSSTIFHILSVRSDPPDVKARSLYNASIAVIGL